MERVKRISLLAVACLLVIASQPYVLAQEPSSLTYIPITYVKVLISEPYTLMKIDNINVGANDFSVGLTASGEGISGFYVGFFYDQHPWHDPPSQTLGPSMAGGDIYTELDLTLNDFQGNDLEWARVSIVNAFWRGSEYAQQYADKTWYMHTEMDVYDVNYPRRSGNTVSGYDALYWTDNVRIMRLDSLSPSDSAKHFKLNLSELDRATYADADQDGWITQGKGYIQCIFIAVEFNGSGSIALDVSNFQVYRVASNVFSNLWLALPIILVVVAILAGIVLARRKK